MDDICELLAKCWAVMFALGVMVYAWVKWPRSEEDRWDEPSSGWAGFLRWFDFFW
jgi:hypothetical protein